MIDLYIDEDSMDGDTIDGLRLRGFDVLTALEAGTRRFTDDQQLAFATEVDRVLLSFNKGDFQRLHTECLAEARSHAGIIIGRQRRYSVGEVIRRIVAMNRSIKRPDWHGRLEFLSNW